MSLSQELTFDAPTFTTAVIAWFIIAGGNLLLGKELIPALLVSFLIASFVCITFVAGGDELKRFIKTPLDALGFCALSLFVALLSFGFDGIFGSVNSSALSVQQAGTSGGASFLTLGLVFLGCGAPLFALLRVWLIAALWRNRSAC